MSEDERILRLENAISTLAELAAEQQRLSEEQQRQAAEQQQLIADRQRLIADQQRRTARLEEAFVAVTDMLRRHEDSFDELRAAQAETDQKLAALVDAQARADDEMSKVREAQAEAGQKIAALVDAQVRIEEAHTRGTEGLRASLTELAETMKRLAESQAHTDRRLDGLIDIVRELRNGRS